MRSFRKPLLWRPPKRVGLVYDFTSDSSQVFKGGVELENYLRFKLLVNQVSRNKDEQRTVVGQVFLATSGIGDDDDSNFETFNICGTLDDSGTVTITHYIKKRPPVTQLYIDTHNAWKNISLSNDDLDFITFFDNDDVYTIDGQPFK